MDDLISRQAAIDALNEYFSRIGKLKKRGLNEGEKAISLDTVGAIKTLPSAQAEIVRCKECKWWKCADESEIIRYGDCTHPSSAIRKNCLPNETWFCADGERKDDDAID